MVYNIINEEDIVEAYAYFLKRKITGFDFNDDALWEWLDLAFELFSEITSKFSGEEINRLLEEAGISGYANISAIWKIPRDYLELEDILRRKPYLLYFRFSPEKTKKDAELILRGLELSYYIFFGDKRTLYKKVNDHIKKSSSVLL